MRRAWMAWAGSALLGCSGSNEPATEKDAAEEPASSEDSQSLPEGAATLHGSFLLLLTAANPETGNEAFSSFQGSLRDAQPIQSVAWELSHSEGDCELHLPLFPFCDPDCISGEVCAPSNTCIQEPAPVSVGDVTLSGLNVSDGPGEFGVSPVGSKQNYLLPGSIALEYPPADPGAPVTLTMEAGSETLVLETAGIDELTLQDDVVAIAKNTDVPLTWSSPTPGGSSVMEIILEISHHGGRKGELSCLTEDDGETTLPASIVTDLINLGYAGFPTITFRRRAVAQSDGPHSIDLTVAQHVQSPVSIDGLVSCTFDDDCDEGQVCQADRSCG